MLAKSCITDAAPEVSAGNRGDAGTDLGRSKRYRAALSTSPSIQLPRYDPVDTAAALVCRSCGALVGAIGPHDRYHELLAELASLGDVMAGTVDELCSSMEAVQRYVGVEDDESTETITGRLHHLKSPPTDPEAA